MEEATKECCICGKSSGKLINLTQKGKDSLSNCAKLRNDEKLEHDVLTGLASHVHENCRKNYTNRSDLIIEQVLLRAVKSVGGLTRGRGFSQSTRDQWALTAHQTASLHEGLTELTGTKNSNSEQHTELSQSRKNRDIEDSEKIYF